MKHFLFIFIAFLFILISSCEKEDYIKKSDKGCKEHVLYEYRMIPSVSHSHIAGHYGGPLESYTDVRLYLDNQYDPTLGGNFWMDVEKSNLTDKYEGIYLKTAMDINLSHDIQSIADLSGSFLNADSLLLNFSSGDEISSSVLFVLTK